MQTLHQKHGKLSNYQKSQPIKLQADLITNVKEATSEEMNEWLENDYFMAMKFDPLVLFVVIPAIIQVVVLAFMLVSMHINGLFFG